MDISQWIRDRRAAAGLTQAQLAAKTGVTQPIVSQWERGIAEPSPIALERLRKLFGESPRPPEPPRRERRETAPAAEAPQAPSGRGRKGRSARSSGNGSGANLGFEDKLWAAAD